MADILSTSTSALLAFQRTLSTISHNVANANTEGYSRQTIDLASRSGQNFGFGFIGAGVQTLSIERMVSSFIFSRGLDSTSEIYRLGELTDFSGRIDQRFSDPNTGLAAPWSEFFDSAQALSTQASSANARTQFLGEAEALARRVRSLDSQFRQMEGEVNSRMRADVVEVNRLSTEVASLNEEIIRQSGTGSQPNDLLDQRELLVRDLAALTGATTQLQDDGALNVFTPSGQALVIGNTAAVVVTLADPYRAERLQLAIQTNGAPASLKGSALGGKLGGLMEFRDNILDTAAQQFGRIVSGLTYQFNQTHRQGMDLYGQPGGDFFTASAPRIAANSANTGAATLSGALSDPGSLDGLDVVLSFDGANWTASNSATGAAVSLTGTGTIADPLVVGGISVVVSGAAAAGDRFLLQPSAGAGGDFRVAITDPNKIAAASLVRGTSDLNNLGNGQIASLKVTDATDPLLGTPVDIDFLAGNSYTVNGGPPIAYSPGDTIAVNGWSMVLSGTPQAGDNFRVSANVPGSSDNSNARSLADLAEFKALDAGNTSFNGAISQLNANIGSMARASNQSLSAQQAIDGALRNERESISGVNLDEEASNMLRFQQAYQAASQMIGVADTLFQSLLAAVRR